MSARNGDKSRFGRQRKQKIARRLELRGMKAALTAPPAEAPASTEAPATGEGKPEGTLTGVARLVGSALGTLAVETHLAGSPAQAE